MITNIFENQLSSNFSCKQTTQKPEVNADFLAIISNNFDNDDIPDAYTQSRVDSAGDLKRISPIAMLGFETENDGTISINDLQKSASNDFLSFQQMLDEALCTAGINKDPAFEITLGGTGKLHINGNHPDKDAIEKILNEVPHIAQTFKRMSANSSLIVAGKKHEEFCRAYELDPHDAISRFRYMFESKPNDKFSIFVSDEDYHANLLSYGNEVNLDWLNND